MRVMLFFFCFLFPALLVGQEGSIISKKSRHRFAQTAFGINQSFTPSHVANIPQQVFTPGKLNFESTTQTTMTFSGLHFWGKVDFYVSFPIFTSQPINKYPANAFNSGVETGLKYFIWKTPFTSLASPFVGLSFNSMDYKFHADNKTSGSEIDFIRTGFHSGLSTILKDKHYVQISASYFYKNKLDYYLSRDNLANIALPPLLFKVGYRYILDTTLSAESSYESGATQKTVEKLEQENHKYLNTFGIGIGLSSAFYIKEESSVFDDYPHFEGDKAAGVFPEFGLGYYHHNWDSHANLSFRSIKRKMEAFDSEYSVSRISLSLDLYKFLFDYHGFVPFIGVSPGYELLKTSFADSLSQRDEKYQKSQIKSGIIFGWDIRPNRLQQFILRTNLRLYPNLGFSDGNFNISFQQLEFNFIQAVFYLDRII